MKYIQVKLEDDDYEQFKTLSKNNLRDVKNHATAIILEAIANQKKENKHGTKQEY